MATTLWSIGVRVGLAVLVWPFVVELAQAPAPASAEGLTGTGVLEGFYLLALVLALIGLALARAARPCRNDKALAALWIPAVYLAALGAPLAAATHGPGAGLVLAAGVGMLLCVPPLATLMHGVLERISTRPDQVAELLATGFAVLAVLFLRGAHPEWLLSRYARPGHVLPGTHAVTLLIPPVGSLGWIMPPPILARIQLAPLLALVALGLVVNAIASRRAPAAVAQDLDPGTPSPWPQILVLTGVAILLLLEVAGWDPALPARQVACNVSAVECAVLALLGRAAWDLTAGGLKAERVLIPLALLLWCLLPAAAGVDRAHWAAPALSVGLAALLSPIVARLCASSEEDGAPLFAFAYITTAFLLLCLDATHWRFLELRLEAGYLDLLWLVDGCTRITMLTVVAAASSGGRPGWGGDGGSTDGRGPALGKAMDGVAHASPGAERPGPDAMVARAEVGPAGESRPDAGMQNPGEISPDPSRRE